MHELCLPGPPPNSPQKVLLWSSISHHLDLKEQVAAQRRSPGPAVSNFLCMLGWACAISEPHLLPGFLEEHWGVKQEAEGGRGASGPRGRILSGVCSPDPGRSRAGGQTPHSPCPEGWRPPRHALSFNILVPRGLGSETAEHESNKKPQVGGGKQGIQL